MTDRLVITCPWCNWQEISQDWTSSEAAMAHSLKVIAEHTRSKHPEIKLKSGAKPKSGWYRGSPIN